MTGATRGTASSKDEATAPETVRHHGEAMIAAGTMILLYGRGLSVEAMNEHREPSHPMSAAGWNPGLESHDLVTAMRELLGFPTQGGRANTAIYIARS